MKYQLWDSVSYGHMEPLVPFTKLFESNTLNDVVEHIDNINSEQTMFVSLKNGDILFNTKDVIYESPDGEVIYKRSPLSNKRTKIN
tara:strand:+ start:212 stop:469 length:258 start_codon:yes stop_codon:yes gene_type:complete